MDVFELMAKLGLDTSEYEEGLKGAENKATSFGSSLKSGIGNAAKVGAAAIAVTTTAIAAGTSALVQGTASVAEYGDNIDKMSQKMGISAEAYQEWDAIMRHSGTTIDALKPSMKTLATQAEKGSDAFQALGISEQEVATLSQEDLFSRVITELQEMEESTERTYLTSQLLGRGATELGALLNTSAKETETMRQRVHELGGVMSDDAVKASAKFQDTLQDMSTGFDSLKRNMMSEFLPSITTVMDGLTNIFTGQDNIGLEKISDGITDFIDNATANLPKFLDLGMNILSALGEGIIQNLPMIADAAVRLIGQLGDFIIQNLPMFVKVGMQIILSLANSLSENLPMMIPTIVSVILQIIQILVDNAPMLIQAALAIMSALAEGILNALPILIKQIPVIITNFIQSISSNLPQIIQTGIEILMALITGLIQAIPDVISASVQIIMAIKDAFANVNWLELGANIIKGIIAGIVNGVGALVDAVKEAAKKALDGAKNFLGIKSPSRVFRDSVGKMIDMGLAEGIEDNTGYVDDAMNDLNDVTTMDFSQPQFQFAGGYGIMNMGAGSSADSGDYGDVITAITDALMNMQLMVNIGNRPIEAMITSAQQRTTYRSGGR